MSTPTTLMDNSWEPTEMKTNFDNSVCLRQYKGKSLYLVLQNNRGLLFNKTKLC